MTPGIITIIAPPGSGKTSDVMAAYPGGLFLTSGSALNPAMALLGFDEVAFAEVADLSSLNATLESLLANDEFAWSAVIVDDYGQRTKVERDVTLGGVEGYKKWAALGDRIAETQRLLLSLCAKFGVDAVVTGHGREMWGDQNPDGSPKMINGAQRIYKGGLWLASRPPTELWARDCAAVYRVTTLATAPTKWKNRYTVDPTDGRWDTKCRYGIVGHGAKVPMNLREIMRAAGRAPARAIGLEWQDATADATADALYKVKAPWQEAVDKLFAKPPHAPSGALHAHIKWAIRDGCARAELRDLLTKNNTHI